MKTIEVLLQGEGIPDIQIIVLEEEAARTEHVLAQAAKHRKGGITGEFLVFAEDEDEPLPAGRPLSRAPDGNPHRLHVHRCRAIAVSVTFNGETVGHRFGPGKTVESVKKWAATTKFGMTPQDAAEHVLQISGTTVRPEPDTHIGALVTAETCAVKFDLVPLKRVEG